MQRHHRIFCVAVVACLLAATATTIVDAQSTTLANSTALAPTTTTTTITVTTANSSATSPASAAAGGAPPGAVPSNTTATAAPATDAPIVSFGGTTTTTAAPTPEPFTMIANTTLRRAEFFAGFVSLTAGIVAMPSSSYAISRALNLLYLSHCNLEDRELYFPVSLGPYMNFGDHVGRYERGAVVGNISVLTVAFVMMLMLGLIKQTPSNNSKYDSVFGQMINTSRLPSYVGILFAVFLDGTIWSAVRLVRVSEVERGKDAIICAVGIVTMICLGIFLYVQLQQVRDGPRPLAYLPCEVRSDAMSFEDLNRYNSAAWRYAMIGEKAWVPADVKQGTAIPPEARRVFHLQYHYRELDPTEGGLNKAMPYFFFYDAIVTGLIAVCGGVTAPCEAMLWIIFVLEAFAFFLIWFFKPFVVPLFNTMIGLQAAALAIAALLIQAGMGEKNWGRYLGEWLALAGAAFAFTPAFIMLVRTILFWKNKAGYGRKATTLDDAERELLKQNELKVAAGERAAADALAKDAENKRLAAQGRRKHSGVGGAALGIPEDDEHGGAEGDPADALARTLASLSPIARMRIRPGSELAAAAKTIKIVSRDDEEMLFGAESPTRSLSMNASSSMSAPTAAASSSAAFAASPSLSSPGRRRITPKDEEVLFGVVDPQSAALKAAPFKRAELEAMFGDAIQSKQRKLEAMSTAEIEDEMALL